MNTVREINEACLEASEGRGKYVIAYTSPSDMCFPHRMQARITRARTKQGVLEGRTLDGTWKRIFEVFHTI